jgi:hypothetical protein
MLVRVAALAALMAVASCAGVESAGRNARTNVERAPTVTSAPRPAPVAATPAPTPPPAAVASAPTPAPRVVATPAPAAAPPVVVASAPPPPQAQPTPTAPSVAAPGVSAPARPRPVSREDDDTVVVPGQVERQVEPPQGDPRSVAERMQDINSWDRCVTNVQSVYERDPMRPQLQSPEEYCAQSLGMANRGAIPVSRTEARRR